MWTLLNSAAERPGFGMARPGPWLAADLLVGCQEGQVATGTTDHVLETLFYHRSAPIAAAIAVTLDAPPDTELVLPEVGSPVWRSE